MKLRNKKTGKTINGNIFFTRDGDIQVSYEVYSHKNGCCSVNDRYDTIEELSEDFEIANSVEPLIKDEKVRKAVRAWAEADDLDNFRAYNEHFNCCKIIGYTAGIHKASFIGFQTTIAHADNKKLYTIADLCGEEE